MMHKNVFYGALMFVQTNIISTTFGRCIKIDLSDENTPFLSIKKENITRRRFEQEKTLIKKRRVVKPIDKNDKVHHAHKKAACFNRYVTQKICEVL